MFGGNNTTCPYCKEKIKKNATKCKHCGEWLSEPQRLSDNNVRNKGNVSFVADSFNHGNEVTVSKAEDLEDKNENTENPTPVEQKESMAMKKNNKPKFFSKLFLFKGRLRRSEYSFSVFCFYMCYILNYVLLGYIKNEIIFFLFYFALVWILFAQGAKRCHDAGYSGWYQLAPFFNIYVLFFADSIYGSNIYGPNPKGNSSNLELATEYYNRGFENRKLKKYGEAVLDYKRAIELNPDDIETYNNLAYCFLEMKKYEDAKIYFDESLKIDKNYLDSLIGMSIWHYEENNFDESRDWMNKAIKIKPVLKDGMKGLEKLEADGITYNDENKDSIKKIFEII